MHCLLYSIVALRACIWHTCGVSQRHDRCVQAAQDAVLFSSHGGRMDPSKLFRNNSVAACIVGGSASDSDASQPAIVKLRPKLDGSSSLKPKVCLQEALPLSASRM